MMTLFYIFSNGSSFESSFIIIQALKYDSQCLLQIKCFKFVYINEE